MDERVDREGGGRGRGEGVRSSERVTVIELMKKELEKTYAQVIRVFVPHRNTFLPPPLPPQKLKKTKRKRKMFMGKKTENKGTGK